MGDPQPTAAIPLMSSKHRTYAVLPHLMACDLASTPNLGIQVQVCGDCHLLNFGWFATPERNLVFDITAFLIKMKYPEIWHHLWTTSYCSPFPVP
jgi:uncharacterized protein (DUF2252 family)